MSDEQRHAAPLAQESRLLEPGRLVSAQDDEEGVVLRQRDRQLDEVIDTATRHATGPGPAELRRRLRRRRRQLVAAAAVMLLGLLGGVVAIDRWSSDWGLIQPPTGTRPRPSATTLQPINPADIFGNPESPKLVGSLRLMAEGSFKGRHWALYLYRGRPAPPDPPGVRWCSALVDWNPAGRVVGWSVGCGVEQELRSGRKLTLSLEEPVENKVFVYHGAVTRRAARVRFQIDDQQPVEARIVNLGAQFPNNWYIAVFSPQGGARTMLDPRVRKTVTVLDAAGRTICAQTFARTSPPAEPQRRRHSGNGDGVEVLAEEEHGEANSRVLGVISGHQLGLRLQDVERHLDRDRVREP